MDLSQDIVDFPRKHRVGFRRAEMRELLERFQLANRTYFDNALYGTTIIKIEGEPVFYVSDVLAALRCAIEKRDLYGYEWD